MNSTDLFDYELRRTHAGPSLDRDARNRVAAVTTRRRARRHRLAERVRSVADRLDV